MRLDTPTTSRGFLRTTNCSSVSSDVQGTNAKMTNSSKTRLRGEKEIKLSKLIPSLGKTRDIITLPKQRSTRKLASQPKTVERLQVESQKREIHGTADLTKTLRRTYYCKTREDRVKRVFSIVVCSTARLCAAGVMRALETDGMF